MTKTQHGIIACVIGAVTWGVNGVASQFLLSNYPVEPSWVASIRMALAGLLLTFMVIPKKSHLIRQMLHDPISLRHLVIFAIFGLTLSQFSYLSAIKIPTPARPRSCRPSASSSCPFYLAVRFHKRPTTREIISVFLAFGGVYLSATPGQPVDDGPLAPWADLGPHGRRRRCRLSRFISRPGCLTKISSPTAWA